MRLPLVKCHGSGNDFPLLDTRALRLDDRAWARIAVALADRAGPVGGDGMLLLTDGDGPERNGAAFGMRMFNADGSESEQCLNGLRCVARMGFARLGLNAATVRLKTSAAQVARAPDLAPGVYTVRETAGPASLDVTRWPMAVGRSENIERPIAALPSPRAFTAVAMPNPHLVAFVDMIDEVELVAAGEACEAAPAWLPNRANVSFVESRGEDLFVRTFERGVGLTDSCGSAMAAATYAACLTGRRAWARELTVFNHGGLVRAAAAEDGMVTLAGNATWEWEGAVEVDAGGAVLGITIERRFEDEAAAWEALKSSPGRSW
ncbi:diaminopimelate epimerase [uncultured Sphingomonas sp.]|uniref:diaminopimelate epimerase n=1 Tax=uncultured Sphingomonas sp. TaxID=158754 RepID=UPI0035CA3278